MATALPAAEIYSKVGCVWCERLKTYFQEHNVQYSNRILDPSSSTYREDCDALIARTGRDHRTFPFVFVDGVFIGGFTETVKWFEELRTRLTFTDEF